MDVDAQRRESRESWNRSAQGWLAQAERYGAATMPVSEWMLEAVAPQPGQTVMDLASGTGELALLAAELVRPGGEAICTDFAPAMLTAAQRRARERGIDNIRFKQVDAQSIDWAAGTLDAILCRWGYMLVPDPAAALRETRRVLRPGRRVALAAWTAPDDNPLMAVPARALVARGLAPPPDPDAPGPFAWAAPGMIEHLLAEAGFVEWHVEALDFAIAMPSFDAWWQVATDCSDRLRSALAALDAAKVAEARAAAREAAATRLREDGSGTLRSRTWVAWASA